MTIDTSWLASFKSEAPHAFTARIPFSPRAVFTDGQIRLMQGGYMQGKLQTWDEYVRNQFLRPLGRFYEHADVVVLAFDNYEFVPAAKCMTQMKRRKNTAPVQFHEHNPLPPHVPQGEMWASCISNRTFKAKVIDYVVCTLPARILKEHPEKKLVIDYQAPELYQVEAGAVTRAVISGIGAMGEADVKFTRWADVYERILVDSIDGDSVAIALLHHEMALSRGECPPRMCIYRMEIKSEEQKEESKKRKAAGKSTRTYEYLNILPLYESLKTACLQSAGRVALPTHQGHEIRMLLALICATGTDFSRNLPGITGRFVFEMMPRVWMALAMCYDPVCDQLRFNATDKLIAVIYAMKYEKHVESTHGMEAVLTDICKAKLSQRTKESLPSPERVDATIRNVNWVLIYWRCGECPSPIAPQFGYKQERGLTKYIDT